MGEFRVWDKESNNYLFLEEEYFLSYTGVLHRFNDDDKWDRHSFMQVVPSVEVELFTGATGSDGVKVFDGDIITTGYAKNYIVFFDEVESQCWALKYPGGRHFPEGLLSDVSSYQVIGTIHD